jgi:hypothetical protein
MSTDRPRQLTYMERAARFPLDFSVTVVDGKPNITVPQTWQGLHLTRLGPYKNEHVAFSPRVNINAAPVFSEFFKLLQEAKAFGYIRSYDGGFNPRLRRSATQPLPGAPKEAWGKLLSNHSRGTAIDLNAQWNPMGKPGAESGAIGSLHHVIGFARMVRVDLETPAGHIWPAGIVCGADWSLQWCDPMHFEVGTWE